MDEKQNQKKKVLILVLVLGLVLLTIGGTYAFFTYSRQGVEEHVLTTGSLYFVYDELPNEEDSNKISIGNAFPVSDDKGMTQDKPGMFEFEVRAKTQGADINYEIYLTKDDISTLQENVVDTYLTTIDQKDGDVASEKALDIPWENVWTKENGVTLYQDLWNSHVPILETEGKKGKSLYQETIKDTEGQEYSKIFRYRMWLDESANKVNGKGEWLYGGKTFSVHVNVYASNETLPAPTPNAIMKSWSYDWDNVDWGSVDWDYVPYPNEDFHTQELASSIVSVKFENKKVTLEDLTDIDEDHKWDISNEEGSPVIAYLEDAGNVEMCVDAYCSEEKQTKQGYNLIIAADGEIYGNPDSGSLFDTFYNLKTIDFDNYNTSMVTNMSNMFHSCSQLTDLSSILGWDTSNVTDMHGIFSYCSQLINLSSISNWDTSSVTDMSSMFSGCSQLTELDLSGWDTSHVIDIGSSLGDFNQDQIDSYGGLYDGMFNGCKNLVEIKGIENWDVSSVKNAGTLFAKCSNLKTLNLSEWTTSSIESLWGMFENCSQLTSVGDLSEWVTSKVTIMSGMFYGCSELTTLDLSGWDTENVKDMRMMFYGCSQLQSLDLSEWDTSSVTDMSGTFQVCSQLTTITGIESLDTSSVTDMHYMFGECSQLNATITIRGNVTDYTGMFYSAATAEGTSITVNYIDDATMAIAQAMVATNYNEGHVSLGEQVA